MSHVASMVRRFVKDEDGIAVTEYGILLALLAAILIIAVNAVGTEFSAWWTNNVQDVTDAAVSPAP